MSSSGKMSQETGTVAVTIVNHVSIEIDCDARRVWNDIIEYYERGRKFADLGYAVTPLSDDPAALLGGYRIVGRIGDVEDERICRITERDDEAMRLSVRADYLAPSMMGLLVHATYQAVPTPSGTRYDVHAYSTMRFPFETKEEKAALAATAAQMREQGGAFIEDSLRVVKARLEGRAAP